MEDKRYRVMDGNQMLASLIITQREDLVGVIFPIKKLVRKNLEGFLGSDDYDWEGAEPMIGHYRLSEEPNVISSLLNKVGINPKDYKDFKLVQYPDLPPTD